MMAPWGDGQMTAHQACSCVYLREGKGGHTQALTNRQKGREREHRPGLHTRPMNFPLKVHKWSIDVMWQWRKVDKKNTPNATVCIISTIHTEVVHYLNKTFHTNCYPVTLLLRWIKIQASIKCPSVLFQPRVPSLNMGAGAKRKDNA